MNKEQVIELISGKMRLIRPEKRYSQYKIAVILEISKKTLIQIEKERVLGGWTTVIAVCALFRDSEILQSLLGEEPLKIIEMIAHKKSIVQKRSQWAVEFGGMKLIKKVGFNCNKICLANTFVF